MIKPLKKEELKIGETYWGFLEQDWVTCVLEEIHDDYVVYNYHGRLWSYGVPQYRTKQDLDWFLQAHEHAPDGHWSRKYDEDQVAKYGPAKDRNFD